LLKKLPFLAAVGAVAVAVPATAQSASHSKKCNTHTVAYTAQGKYASSSPSLVASGSWSGSLTLKLQSANHHFTKANGLKVKGTSYTFAITGAKAKFGKGVKGAVTTRDHITVAGRVTEFSGKCTASAPTVHIKSISVSK
jgi:hypothetical protein